MKKSSLKFSAGLSKFLFYFGNIVIGIIFVSPLILMISASLKPEAEIFANMNSIRTFIPTHASFANYAEVFTRMNLPRVFRNTLLYIALILILDLLLNSMCGYALAKFNFKGKFKRKRKSNIFFKKNEKTKKIKRNNGWKNFYLSNL